MLHVDVYLNDGLHMAFNRFRADDIAAIVEEELQHLYEGDGENEIKVIVKQVHA